jgi:large subunit ribosomal protein L4e
LKSKTILGVDGRESNSIELPEIFETPYRPEVIHKVCINLLSHTYQRQGRYPAAGEIVSSESRNTGLGIARIARARGEGFQRAGQAAGVAGVRHGRVAHPPESWKTIRKKINKKEKLLGFCSAIAATGRKDLIIGRGHKVGKVSNFPIVVSNDIEYISKTRDLRMALLALGLEEDLIRARSSYKRRTGTARRRGRSARSGVSALIVVENDENLGRLSESIPGVEVRSVQKLNIIDLVPGSKAIRLTIFSQNAIEKLKDVKAPFLRIMRMMTSK